MKLRQLRFSILAKLGAFAVTAGTACAQGNSGPPMLASLGETANEMIDNLHAVAVRSLELPLFIPLGALAALGLGVAFITVRISRKRKSPGIFPSLLVAEGLLLLFAGLFVVDRKIARIEAAVSDLRAKTTRETLLRMVPRLEPRTGLPLPITQPAPPIPIPTPTASVPQPQPVPPVPGAGRTSALVDPVAAQRALLQQFPGVTVQSVICDEALDFVQLQFPTPQVWAYLAIVDLKNPRVEIKVGGDLNTKTLTSTFARANNCIVAINGEAGSSPSPTAPLGQWRGNFVQQGTTMLREMPPVLRPYLSFDRESRPQYTSATAEDRNLAPNQFNVMWGRWDSLLNGAVQNDNSGRQPRTAMAINKEGSLLYLLVVDGRQPTYSIGFTQTEIGQCLLAFGAYNGMMCDQGGSSCMYLETLNGIANVPSDGPGVERITYTHFGVALRAEKQ